MAKKNRLYNHRSKVESYQSVHLKYLTPGTVSEFRYEGEKISDRRPMVIVLYNELIYGTSSSNLKNALMHAINLNYLPDIKVTKLFEILSKGSGVYSPKNTNIIVEEDQVSTSVDDNYPGRNLLKKPFTQIQLPFRGRIREGNPLSKSEASRQMEVLYKKVLRHFINFHDVYRTYSSDKIKELKVIHLKQIKGL